MQAEITERQRRYREYLQTPAWQEKREAALERAGHRCQLCNQAKRLQVHHRTYERVGNEAPGDLTVLCNDCHEKFHGIDGSKPQRVEKRTQAKSPKKARRPSSRNSTVDRLRAAVVTLDPGSLCTTKELAALAHLPASVAGQAATVLVDERVLERVRKGRWRVGMRSVRPAYDPLAIACPSCGAPPGQVCPMGGVHMSRYRDTPKNIAA